MVYRETTNPEAEASLLFADEPFFSAPVHQDESLPL